MFKLALQEIVRILIYIQYHRLSKTFNSYEVFIKKVFNKLPLCLQGPDCVYLDMVKLKLYKWLMLHPFYGIREYFEANIVLWWQIILHLPKY